MKKPLQSAAWAGIWSLFLVLLTVLVGFIFPESAVGRGLIFVIGVVATVFSFVFWKGFIVLGKKFDSTLVQVMAWISIAIGIISLAVSTVMNIAMLARAQTGDVPPEAVMALLVGLVLFWIVISVLAGAYSILLGVGILKMKDKLKNAKTAGILNIVAGATYIILVGVIVAIAAYVFQIKLLFEASEKFESGKSRK